MLIQSILFSFLVTAVPFEGNKLVVTGPSPLAAKAGVSVAEQGGNVVDVAVAYGLTLSVTSPYFGALGGGGFALIKMQPEKAVKVLDFREVAPAKTSPRFYLDKGKKASTLGGTAVGVPGFPAGLWEMHKKYGKLPWKSLFAHALKASEEGFRVSGEWVRNTNRAKEHFDPGAMKHFTKSGEGYIPGQILKQPDLGKALRLLQEKGRDGFYKGKVAKDLVDSVRKNKGVLSEKDLKDYQVKWRTPLTAEFEGHKIHLMPPPSSGGVVIQQALKMASQLNLKKEKPLSLNELHLLGEIMNLSFRSRTLLGDPDFSELPLKKIAQQTKHANKISRFKSKKWPGVSKVEDLESIETTHFSVLDINGNSVSLTVTLNGNYGSKMATEKYGIALNNEMDDFTTRPGEPNMFGLIQGKANQVEPGKRPLSSMSPTLVTKNGKVVMSVGSPGGPRIINSVFQVIYRVLVNGWDIDKAIQAPRVHHQYAPFRLYVDKDRFSPEVLEGLRRKGHDVRESSVAKVYGARINKEGWLEAAYDSRGEGAAAGF